MPDPIQLRCPGSHEKPHTLGMSRGGTIVAQHEGRIWTFTGPVAVLCEDCGTLSRVSGGTALLPWTDA